MTPESNVTSTIAGPAAAALDSLTPSQRSFIQALPKAELHAHLNGSIPINVLQELGRAYLASQASSSNISSDMSTTDINTIISNLAAGVSLSKIDDFFFLFPAIYALTSTPSSLALATRGVLSAFLDGTHPQCTYLELRTTPRAIADGSMNRETYLRTVLAEIERYDVNQASLVVSLDRRMSEEVLSECLSLACRLKSEGLRIVGVDLCGDPMAGDVEIFRKYFEKAKSAGLSVTLHIAETLQNPHEETMKLLSVQPNRLGHATFLDDEAIQLVLKNGTPIEICLSSNLLCKTVNTLDSHHIRHYLQKNHPIAICTDDILPFRTSLEAEYALLLAQPPLGLGLTEDEVRTIGGMSLNAAFGRPAH